MRNIRRPLAVLVFGIAAIATAANIPWTYDTSKRTEVVPSSAQSAVMSELDAQPDDTALSAGSPVDSQSVFVALTLAGINLNALPCGFCIFLQ